MKEGLLDAALLRVSVWIEAGVIAVIVGGSMVGTNIIKGSAVGRAIRRASITCSGEGIKRDTRDIRDRGIRGGTTGSRIMLGKVIRLWIVSQGNGTNGQHLHR